MAKNDAADKSNRNEECATDIKSDIERANAEVDVSKDLKSANTLADAVKKSQAGLAKVQQRLEYIGRMIRQRKVTLPPKLF